LIVPHKLDTRYRRPARSPDLHEVQHESEHYPPRRVFAAVRTLCYARATAAEWGRPASGMSVAPQESRQMGRRQSIVVALALAALVACAAPTPTRQATGGAAPDGDPSAPAAPAAQPAAPRQLTIGNSSIGSVGPLWITRDAGLFARYGLDVEIPYLSGVKAVQALVARQVEFGFISGRTSTDARLAGADVVLLAGLAPTLVFQIFGAPGITQPTDLRGKTIGITQFGASTDFAARYGLRRFGLEADRDYSLFQTGGTPESLAALQIGGIQAAVLSSPSTVTARKAGLPLVVDVGSLQIEYVSGALSLNRDFLIQEPDVTRRLLKALLEGIRYAKTEPAAAKEILGRNLQSTDPDVLEESYELQVVRFLQRVPYVPAAGIRTVLEEVAAEFPQARDLSPEQLVDNSLLQEIEASGFVKQLWGE
jgi:NitT/TauT family transport system substrate-binding protein